MGSLATEQYAMNALLGPPRSAQVLHLSKTANVSLGTTQRLRRNAYRVLEARTGRPLTLLAYYAHCTAPRSPKALPRGTIASASLDSGLLWMGRVCPVLWVTSTRGVGL